MDINNSAYKLLKRLYKGKSLNTNLPSFDDDINYLLESKCVKEVPAEYSATRVVIKTKIEILPYGKAVIETKRRMMLKHWIPYFITTAISLLSLYNSVLARLGH